MEKYYLWVAFNWVSKDEAPFILDNQPLNGFTSEEEGILNFSSLRFYNNGYYRLTIMPFWREKK